MVPDIEKVLSSRWWYALAYSCISYYLFTVINLADNTPKFDDLNDVFGFFKQLSLAQTPLQNVGAFFYPNNEHVTLVNHLIYFMQYRLFGEIGVFPLIILGHLIIIGTGCLLGSAIISSRKPFYFAVITIGYINLYYWDSSFKAMTAISNQAVILFSVATFFALLRWHKLPLALMFAFLASFSQGNGILVWPLGLLVLLTDNHWQLAKWRYVFAWLAAAVIVFSIFGWAHHVYYQAPLATADMFFLQLQKFPMLPLLSTLAFLGSMAFTFPQATLAAGVGGGALLLFIWHAVFHQDRNKLALIIALYILASAVTVGLMRGLAFSDANSVLASRYKMYSVAFVLLALVLLCEQLRRPAFRSALAALVLVVSMGIQASSYSVAPDIEEQAQKFSESYRYWLEDGDFRRQTIYFIPMSDHFLFAAEHLKIFDFMQLAPNGAILARLPAVSGRICPPTPAPADHCPMTIRHRGNALFVVIDGAATDVDTNQQPATPANITLCDEQANAVMEFVTPENQASRQHWLIPEADIPAGNYRVLFQSAQQPVCETQLTKKPRKVETEMRTLFGS